VCAVRDADDGQALPVLADLLVTTSAAADVNEGTLINLMSAVEYAMMLPDEARAGWTPPAEAIVSLVRRALGSNELLHEQAADLLGTLVDEGLADGWLGRDATRDLIGG
jgi:hypothetical protein